MAVIDQRVTEEYALYRGDCVEVLRGMPDNSLQFSISSPPFGSLYSYTDATEDFSNVRTKEEFFTGMEFMVKELRRSMMPGRIVAFHCMNLPFSIERDGFIGIDDFRGDLIRLYLGNDAYGLAKARERLIIRAAFAELDGDVKRSVKLQNAAEVIQEELSAYPGDSGFIFHSEVVIWKDPLIAATRTHALGLAHKQIVTDSAMCRTGIPDYLVAMRKPGKNPEPVSHLPAGFTRWIGKPEDDPKAEKKTDPKTNKYSHYVWQNYASPVWMDIDPSDTLQLKSAREDDDARHICPLQLTVIRRAIELWSNPGDVVFTPFAGIGSEMYVAIEEGRRAVGSELKESYWRNAVANCDAALEKRTQGKLDFAGATA